MPTGLPPGPSFARLWRSWAGVDPVRPLRCLAYPTRAALRAWSWCGLHRALVTGSDIGPALSRPSRLTSASCAVTWEYDLGGNHLIKGLKALVGLAVFFADERLLRRALRRAGLVR